MFCIKCGALLEDTASFCPSCGAKVQENAIPSNPSSNRVMDQVSDTVRNFNNTTDWTNEFAPADIEQNKMLSLFSYLGIFVIIPWLAAPNSPYAKFHVKQGVTLFVVDIAYGILSFLIGLIKITKYKTIWGISVPAGSVTPWFLSIPLNLIGLGILVLAIIGIVNAVTGKAKELPLIGKIHILK